MRKFLLNIWEGWKRFNLPVICEIEQEEQWESKVTLPKFP